MFSFFVCYLDFKLEILQLSLLSFYFQTKLEMLLFQSCFLFFETERLVNFSTNNLWAIKGAVMESRRYFWDKFLTLLYHHLKFHLIKLLISRLWTAVIQTILVACRICLYLRNNSILIFGHGQDGTNIHLFLFIGTF